MLSPPSRTGDRHITHHCVVLVRPDAHGIEKRLDDKDFALWLRDQILRVPRSQPDQGQDDSEESQDGQASDAVVHGGTDQVVRDLIQGYARLGEGSPRLDCRITNLLDCQRTPAPSRRGDRRGSPHLAQALRLPARRSAPGLVCRCHGRIRRRSPGTEPRPPPKGDSGSRFADLRHRQGSLASRASPSKAAAVRTRGGCGRPYPLAIVSQNGRHDPVPGTT